MLAYIHTLLICLVPSIFLSYVLTYRRLRKNYPPDTGPYGLYYRYCSKSAAMITYRHIAAGLLIGGISALVIIGLQVFTDFDLFTGNLGMLLVFSIMYYLAWLYSFASGRFNPKKYRDIYN